MNDNLVPVEAQSNKRELLVRLRVTNNNEFCMVEFYDNINKLQNGHPCFLAWIPGSIIGNFLREVKNA